MQMISVSKKKMSKRMLSSLKIENTQRPNERFEKQTVKKVFDNDNIKQALEMLAKV